MSTEREKMIRGELYLSADPELAEGRLRARKLMHRYNSIDPEKTRDEHNDILRELFGSFGNNVHVEGPIFCDYGSQVHIGDRVFVNFNCVFLDCSTITIGSDTQIAPGVQLLTATHPIDAAERASGAELAAPITIGSRVWLGGGVLVLPGVTIGDDTVVGAGSVVTKSLPPRVVAVGNPARVIRAL